MSSAAPDRHRPDLPARPSPTRLAFFLAYLQIGLSGFGGANAWMRRVIVEERGWLSEQEYAEYLGLAQILPGPNALNCAVMIGDRFHGTAGAALALLGILGGPLVPLVGIAGLYAQYGSEPLVAAALKGLAAAAAGMTIGTALKMGTRLRPGLALSAVGACALVGIGLLRLPMLGVVLALAPLGILAAWLTPQRGGAAR
jgi:chromate transporter